MGVEVGVGVGGAVRVGVAVTAGIGDEFGVAVTAGVGDEVGPADAIASPGGVDDDVAAAC